MRNLLTAMLGMMLGAGLLAPATGDDSKSERDAPDAEAKFKMLDKNGDSKLSLEEFVAGRRSDQSEQQAKEIFKQADIDKDGFLSLAEYKTTVEKKPEKVPPRLTSRCPGQA
jgi:Ca2+-binding EF-hand superfamily protein